MAGSVLVWLSVILVVSGVVIATSMPRVAGLITGDKAIRNEIRLEEARNAIEGFAVAKGRLPCPDTDNDGAEDCVSVSTSNPVNLNGDLPYRTIGVGFSRDVYGDIIRYAVYGSGTADATTDYLADPALETDVTGQFGRRLQLASLTAGGYLHLTNVGATSADNVPFVVVSSGPDDEDHDGADLKFDGNNENATLAFDEENRPVVVDGYDDQVVSSAFNRDSDDGATADTYNTVAFAALRKQVALDQYAFQINTTDNGVDQINSAAVGLGNGGFAVFWEDHNSGVTNLDVFAKFFTHGGVEQAAGEVGVNGSTLNDQQEPDAAYLNGNSRVVAVWSSDHSGDFDVYMRQFNESGVAQTTEAQVNTTTTTTQGNPAVAALSGGGYVVVWDSDQSTTNFEVFAQIFADDGTPDVSGELRISAVGAVTNQTFPQVAGLDGGGFVVTWVDEGNGAGDLADILFRRYNATGTALDATPVTATSTTANNQDYPDVIGLSTGGYAVVWRTVDGSLPAADQTQVFGRIFNSSGAQTVAEFTVNTTQTNTQDRPRLASWSTPAWATSPSAWPTTDFFVTWYSDQTTASDYDVYAKRFSATGTVVLDEFQVNLDTTTPTTTTTTNDQQMPAIDALTDDGGAQADGGYFISWESDLTVGDSEVFGKQFNP